MRRKSEIGIAKYFFFVEFGNEEAMKLNFREIQLMSGLFIKSLATKPALITLHVNWQRLVDRKAMRKAVIKCMRCIQLAIAHCVRSKMEFSSWPLQFCLFRLFLSLSLSQCALFIYSSNYAHFSANTPTTSFCLYFFFVLSFFFCCIFLSLSLWVHANILFSYIYIARLWNENKKRRKKKFL